MTTREAQVQMAGWRQTRRGKIAPGEKWREWVQDRIVWRGIVKAVMGCPAWQLGTRHQMTRGEIIVILISIIVTTIKIIIILTTIIIKSIITTHIFLMLT